MNQEVAQNQNTQAAPKSRIALDISQFNAGFQMTDAFWHAQFSSGTPDLSDSEKGSTGTTWID